MTPTGTLGRNSTPFGTFGSTWPLTSSGVLDRITTLSPTTLATGRISAWPLATLDTLETAMLSAVELATPSGVCCISTTWKVAPDANLVPAKGFLRNLIFVSDFMLYGISKQKLKNSESMHIRI
jgi:hypothetical protein